MLDCKHSRRLIAIGTVALSIQAAAMGQSLDTPTTRLKPISAPSAVDQFRGPYRGSTQSVVTEYRETAYQPAADATGGVRQVAMQVPGNQITLPLQTQAPIPGAQPPTPAPTLTNPPLPPNPRALPTGPAPSVLSPASPTAVVPTTPVPTTPYLGDEIPLAQPQLNDAFATAGNNCCVSGPSGYTAAMANGCATVAYQTQVVQPVAPTAAPVATQIVTPVATPVAAPAPKTGIPKSALISFGQEKYPVQVGQGLFGQPVAYVPGQKFRNWIRYVFP